MRVMSRALSARLRSAKALYLLVFSLFQTQNRRALLLELLQRLVFMPFRAQNRFSAFAGIA
ncbi:hypothetical protein KYK30_02255 [Shinella yambaruensis]|uniref:hypothetical protein n=1 Tax=Shinella yambaruensis TaxID=415996 RepID=UPI001FD573E9|nr:hypothetical protein [Shinella yambaruensis]MCJ8025776.1 hypothetical protein [Shinella yambaruensis]MCU7978502.1 hypothetical protein [Shinella yambaruensis]